MRTALIIALSVILSVLATHLVMAPEVKNDAVKETAFDRVMRTRTIRCGYFVMDSLLTKDLKTGRMAGPGYEIVVAMAKNLNLKVDWVSEAGFAAMAEDLKNGRYDMVCTPFAPNAARAQVMDLSRTAFSQPFTVWLHKDDPRLLQPDQSWLNTPATKFTSIDGTAISTVVRSFFPKATIVSLPELTPVNDIFLELSSRKVDAMGITTYNAAKFAERNDGIIRRYGDLVISNPPYQYALPKGDYELTSMVNIALEELIYNGIVDGILDRYDPQKIYYGRVKL